MAEWMNSLWSHLQNLTPTQKFGATLLSIAGFAFEGWAIARALTRGHGVQGTLTWLFAILAFPFVGAASFFLFASPSVKRVVLRRRRSAAQVRKSLGIAPARVDGASETGDSLVDLAVALTGLAPSAGNQIEMLTDDVPTFERIEAAIRAARRFVWAEYYIIRNDETGRRFLALLEERAKEGVEVRLLFDAVGSMAINARFLRAIVAAGGQARAFEPMNPLRRRLSVNLRNHRKLVVVDGEVGFTGGMNVGDEYSGRRRREGTKSFRDSHLQVRGPAVRSMAEVFVEDWAFASGETLTAPRACDAVSDSTSLVAIVPSGPDQEHNASAMVHFAGIASARHRVYLTSPYFIPDDATLSALVSSALRRADVRVLLPRADRSDVKMAAFAARSFYGKLLRGGVRIYEYGPSMLHAKTLAVDGQIAYVGSANIDIVSFRLNFEIGVLINDPAFAGALEKRFVRDLANSREVTLEDLERTSRFTKALCVLARLFSPIL
jgi:cardiolipin synthase